MRLLLVIAACLSVSGCDAFYTPQFDIHRMQEWRLCRNADGAKVEAHLPTDAKHCGVCGNACGDGVICVEGECNYSTRIHCGGPGRTCIGFTGGVDVDCVYVGDADFDPALGPVARGYACAPVASTPMEPIDAPVLPPIGEGVVEPVEQIVGDPPLEPDWILVPGRSTNCRESVDRSCYFTEVEVRDVCGESCTAHIEHDFELMTTEMSRAMYRDLVLECDCTGPEAPQCAELCADDDEEAVLPVTGLSWCEAYDACRAVGGRLPTVIERARVEAMVDVDRGLFSRPDVCGEWVDTVGSAPRVAECFDRPESLELERVDGLEAAVPIGTEVLPNPRYFHHLFGNADEWLGDPVEGATCKALTQPRPWERSATPDQLMRPRIARGRGLYSPAGETGDRMLALDPSVASLELGVRCARTSVDTASEPTPYDASGSHRAHAACERTATGMRPVRHSLGERVLRARRVCLDRPSTLVSDPLLTLLERFFADDPVGLARHAFGHYGPVELGQARFAADEQWWVGEPARAPGRNVEFTAHGQAVDLLWEGEYEAFGAACADWMEEDSASADTDGRLVLGESFRIGREALAPFTLRGTSEDAGRLACETLECVEFADPDGDCVEACQAWRLPVVVEFQRVTSMDRSALCSAATAD